MSSEQTGGVPAGTVQKSTWVVVQVSGQYNATPNPACGSQPPNWPCILNPPASSFYAPAPFTSGPVQAWVESGGISAIPLRGTGGGANTAGQAVGLYFAPAAGQLMIRSAVENYITPNPNPGAQVSSWIISGSYNASATKISNPLTFSGGPTGAPDGTVTFTVGTTAPLLFINPNGVPASSPPGDVDWYIVPGDAVPLTYERTSPAYQIFACYRQATCTYTPPPNLNGRMQVAAYVEGQLVIGRSDYIRNPCQSGSAGCEQVPTLVLRCDGRTDTASVVRGSPIDCQAVATPAPSGPITWEFVADSFPYRNPGEGSTAHTGVSWAGKMVLSGTITARATIQSRPFEAKVIVRVTGRDWRGKEFDVSVAEDDSTAGEFRARPDTVRQLGHIHTESAIVITRGFWEPILSGPNDLLGYFVKVPITFHGRVHVNRLALRDSSDFWTAQLAVLPELHEGQAVPCLRSAVVPFIPVVLKHEGIGLDPKSHAYLWIEEGKKEFGPAAEPVVGVSANDLYERVKAVLDSAIQNAHTASDAADSTGNRPEYCVFNYNYERATP